MRTSNKILLSIFIGPLIILTALQLTLYAKYKSGNYVAMKTVKEDRFMRYAPKNINHVAVYGLSNFHLIPADSVKLEIEKDLNSHLKYTVIGDSLIIRVDSIKSGGSYEFERSYQEVNLFLPASESITIDNSDMILQGSKDSTKAQSYHFFIVNSAVFKIEQYGDDSTQMHFKEVTIKASHSAGIEFTAQSHIADLQLSMIESAFTDNGASIDKLMIDADKESNISLKGDNLKKVNLK
jgi:uncharacterized membrane protein